MAVRLCDVIFFLYSIGDQNQHQYVKFCLLMQCDVSKAYINSVGDKVI